MVKSIALAICLTASVAQANDLKCLADNIYHEARGESFLGQVAVGLVTMQRVNSKHYPDNVCQVVYQPKAFSWTSRKTKVTENEAMKSCVLAAKMALSSYDLVPASLRADHYHNTSVQPYWASSKVLLGQIGNHKFYR